MKFNTKAGSKATYLRSVGIAISNEIINHNDIKEHINYIGIVGSVARFFQTARVGFPIIRSNQN